MDATLQEVKSVLAEVDRKMDEFQGWVSYVKPTDMTGEIPMEIVNTGQISLNYYGIRTSASRTAERRSLS